MTTVTKSNTTAAGGKDSCENQFKDVKVKSWEHNIISIYI